MSLSPIVRKTLQSKKTRALPGGIPKKIRQQYKATKGQVISRLKKKRVINSKALELKRKKKIFAT